MCRNKHIVAVFLMCLSAWMKIHALEIEAEASNEGTSVEEQNLLCSDNHIHCEFWAGLGECEKNPDYMFINCCYSCKNIKNQSACAESDPFCKAAQLPTGVPKGANEYGTPRSVNVGTCEDRHIDRCVLEASRGECVRNPGWMIINCPHSCNACHLLERKVRCSREHLNISNTPVYGPGDHSKMFSGLKEKYDALHGVTVHSTDPWVVTFDNFVTDEEADALISTQESFERSTDTGKVNEYGETGRVLSKGRTSTNSWCKGNCMSHPLVDNLTRRIEEAVGIPRANYENFQVLRYDLGQHYRAHHDMGVRDNEKPCGPRILTFFLYLSDVEEGGETSFPDLNIAVKPKKGRALLWPSTLDSDPSRMDIRTRHEAKPVIKGIKFAANAWIHLYNFQKPNLWGCTGPIDEL